MVLFLLGTLPEINCNPPIHSALSGVLRSIRRHPWHFCLAKVGKESLTDGLCLLLSQPDKHGQTKCFWQNHFWNSLIPHFHDVTIQCLWWKFLFQHKKPDSFFRFVRWETSHQHPFGGPRWAEELHKTGEHSRAQERVAAITGSLRGCARTGSGLAWMLGRLSALVHRERPAGTFRAQRDSTEKLCLFCLLVICNHFAGWSSSTESIWWFPLSLLRLIWEMLRSKCTQWCLLGPATRRAFAPCSCSEDH